VARANATFRERHRHPGLGRRAVRDQGPTSAAVTAEPLALDFDAASVRIRVAAAGAETTLRFAQLRRITLNAARVVKAPASNDPPAHLLANQPLSEYRLWLAGGSGWISARTVGHVQTRHGGAGTPDSQP
jgi:hypothetical protein